MRKISLKKALLASVPFIATASIAIAAGVWTLNLPTVTPGSIYPRLSGYERLPMDTELSGGAQPQSAAPTTFMVASMAGPIRSNTGTASGGAVTLSTKFGTITSEALTTAAGATYTLTLTNTTVTATSSVQAAAYLGTSTGGQVVVTSITPASGSVVIVVKNVGTSAINGTIIIPFQTF